MNLPQFSVSVSATIRPTVSLAAVLPQFVLLQPVTYTIAGTGGAQAGGAAYVVDDPYIMSASGGAISSGGALVVYAPVVAYQIMAQGGAAVGGTAPVYDSSFYPTGVGAQASGAAVVNSFILNPVLNAALPALRSALTGLSAYIDATLPAIHSTLTGYQGAVGSVNTVLPAMHSTLVGYTQSMNVALPALDSQLTGLVGIAGALNAQLSPLAAALVGNNAIIGNINARINPIGSNLTGLVGSIGALNTALPAIRSSLVGAVGNTGVLTARIGALHSALVGHTTITGAINAVIPAIRSELLGTLREALVSFIATNTVTSALSSYEGIGVNSMCKFGDKFLFADATGIHVMDNDTDNGVSIDAHIESGLLDFTSGKQKRVLDAYVGMRATGDLTLTVTADENIARDYVMAPHSVSTIRQRQTVLAKGVKAKYWQYRIANTNGCDFDIDSLDFNVEDISRRV